MKDAYSFHATQEDFDRYYERVVDAYRAIFRRLDLPILVVESDIGMMGGKAAHEFMLLADGGEDSLLVCPHGDYAANQEIAVAARDGAKRPKKTPQEIQEIHTPGATTIAALCEAAGCTPDETVKAVFYTAAETTVVALLRGDLEVNEVKLRNVLGRDVCSLAPEAARARGLAAGYAGPVNLRVTGPVLLVADDSVAEAGSLIAGANRADYHLRGVTYRRDYHVDVVGDIALVTPGMPCVRCGAPLELRRGIEAGNTFKLGTRYTSALGATFPDETGNHTPMIMGCYGLGITRALACVIEQHHDADGIIWPASVAPYSYHLVVVGSDAPAHEAAERIYAALDEEQTLYDDRDASAGIKLKDADLLGMPVRVTLSARSLKTGGAELRVRRTGETRIVTVEEVARQAVVLLRNLQ